MIYKERRSYFASDGTCYVETWEVDDLKPKRCLESRSYDPKDPDLEIDLDLKQIGELEERLFN